MPLEIFTILYSNIKHTFVRVLPYTRIYLLKIRTTQKLLGLISILVKQRLKQKSFARRFTYIYENRGKNTEYSNKFTFRARKRLQRGIKNNDEYHYYIILSYQMSVGTNLRVGYDQRRWLAAGGPVEVQQRHLALRTATD